MITILVLAACLLVVALLLGKRFGVPILGLATGLVIAQYVAATAVAVGTPYLHQYTAYVPAALVILPALILMLFVKGRHRKIIPRVISAVIFAGAAAAFVLAAPLTPAAIASAVPMVTNNLGLIIPGLIGLAVLEASFGKASKKKVEEPHK